MRESCRRESTGQRTVNTDDHAVNRIHAVRVTNHQAIIRMMVNDKSLKGETQGESATLIPVGPLARR